MNILLIHHNERPSQLHAGIQRGEGIRCEHLGDCSRTGFTVQYLCKTNWERNWSQVISSTLKGNHFDAIILLQVSDIHLLPPVDCPPLFSIYMLLDFSRSHLNPITIKRYLFLLLLEKQMYSSAHIKGNAGIGGVFSHLQVSIFAKTQLLIVPLAIDTAPKQQKNENTIFVGGGITWPWQSPGIKDFTKALAYLSEEDLGQLFGSFLQNRRKKIFHIYIHC